MPWKWALTRAGVSHSRRISYLEGYKAVGQLTVSGPDALAKARHHEIDDTLGHGAVGRELASRDGNHAARTGPHLVLARNLVGRLALLADEGAKAGPSGHHVVKAEVRDVQRAARRVEQVGGVVLGDLRPVFHLRMEGVGGAEEGEGAARDGEH